MSVIDDAAALQGDLVQLRRALHRRPELGLQLPRTQDTVLAALDGLPLEISTGRNTSSVIGVLRGRGQKSFGGQGDKGTGGQTVLLRGDMDALPVTEKNALDFRSTEEDRMHACGHDLHTSMLVGAARLLAAQRDQLAGDVVFMFQPGEEGYDGASVMVEEGVLDAAGERPVAAYALHVSSAFLGRGVFASRRGPMLAASDTIRVVVHGAGGHGSAPYRALDPVPAACEMVTALQTFVSRRFDVFDPVVCTVGAFHAGTQHNVIPDAARFEATVRSFSAESHQRFKEESVHLLRSIAAAHGLTVEVSYEDLYPVTVNHAAEAEFVADTVAEVHGADRFGWLPNPLAGSEDFSRVSAAVPGVMTMLGACPADRDPSVAPYNHSPLAQFDDAVLGDGAAIYAELALRRLKNPR